MGLFFDCNSSPKHQDLKIALFKAINRNWQKYEQGIMPHSHLSIYDNQVIIVEVARAKRLAPLTSKLLSEYFLSSLSKQIL